MVVRTPTAALGLCLLALTLSPSTSASAQRSVYVVRAGDVLSRIAEQNRVSVQQLREWNAIDGDRIQPGQELVTAPEPPPAAGIPYRIQRGDTLAVLTANILKNVSSGVDRRSSDGQGVEVTVRVGVPSGCGT